MIPYVALIFIRHGFYPIAPDSFFRENPSFVNFLICWVCSGKHYCILTEGSLVQFRRNIILLSLEPAVCT